MSSRRPEFPSSRTIKARFNQALGLVPDPARIARLRPRHEPGHVDDEAFLMTMSDLFTTPFTDRPGGLHPATMMIGKLLFSKERKPDHYLTIGAHLFWDSDRAKKLSISETERHDIIDKMRSRETFEAFFMAMMRANRLKVKALRME